MDKTKEANLETIVGGCVSREAGLKIYTGERGERKNMAVIVMRNIWHMIGIPTQLVGI